MAPNVYRCSDVAKAGLGEQGPLGRLFGRLVEADEGAGQGESTLGRRLGSPGEHHPEVAVDDGEQDHVHGDRGVRVAGRVVAGEELGVGILFSGIGTSREGFAVGVHRPMLDALSNIVKP